MSADSWAHCPKCHKKYVESVAKREAEIAKAYETMYAKVYELWKAKLPPVEEDVETFREDWEIGLVGEELIVKYRGGCSSCGLTLRFNHKEKLKWDL